MRIIAGTRRGQKLYTFEGADVRPTTDRVRESMFNLIQDFIRGSVVLDLFGGSGALSLEALSRGARQAVITDIDKRSIQLIRRNGEKTGFLEQIELLQEAAAAYLERTRRRFDVVFLDPPYNQGLIVPTLELIVRQDVLAEDGIAVLESDFQDKPGEIPGLTVLKQKKYGRSCITIYQRGDRQ